jgi:signal transduction histidine kinase
MMASYGIAIKPGEKIFEFLEKTDPNEALWWERTYTKAMSGHPVRFVKDYSSPDKPYFLNFSIHPINQNNEVIGLSCFARDITEKRVSEIEMAKLNQRLSLATMSAGMGTWEWDIKSNVLSWDDAMYRLYNVNQSEFTSVYDGWFSRVHPDDKAHIGKEMSMALKGEKKYSVDFRIFWDDLSIRHIRATGIIEKDESGNAIRMIGLNWDITERKNAEIEIKDLNENLEKRIKERTAELNDAIKELETFNYTVSHDLQAPLRVIIGMAGIIISEYGDKIDNTGKEYLQYISDNSLKMSRLIKDLLDFARLGKTESIGQMADMSSIVESVIVQAKMAHPDIAAAFIVNEMPPAFCDQALIKQVWNNLIMNAVKYSGKKENPVIEIGSKLINETTVYYVKDNGVGFDMQYADKLFGVFARLHSDNDFEGSGIGLATVRRILNKHAGEVWAEARVNEGATFYFSLPGI